MVCGPSVYHMVVLYGPWQIMADYVVMLVLILLSDCLKVYANDFTDVICKVGLAYWFTNPEMCRFPLVPKYASIIPGAKCTPCYKAIANQLRSHLFVYY